MSGCNPPRYNTPPPPPQTDLGILKPGDVSNPISQLSLIQNHLLWTELSSSVFI